MRNQATTVLLSAVIAALGGLLFGFDTAVISGGIDALQREYGLSSGEKGFTTASALIGTILGAMLVGRPCDRWGRRRVMMVLAVLYLVSAVGSALAWDWHSFLVMRFIGGLGVGGASVVSPMYICEIAPASKRGRLGMLAQFNIVLGILLAFGSNYLITQLELGDTTWRWMFGVEAAPALAYLLLLGLVPESPRWLVARGRRDEAAAVMGRTGTDLGRSIEDEIGVIERSLAAEGRAQHEPFFQAKYRVPILLAIAIAAFNQLSGINAILYYAPTIFKSAGAGEDSALLQSVGLGLMNLVFTMAAMAVIDFLGRKTLMLVCSVGYIVSLGATAMAFFTQASVDAEGARTFSDLGGVVVLAGLLLFIASHAFGQGAVIWVFISEVFPNRARARGQALGSFTHWVFAAAISWTFPIIAEASGGWVFAFYGLCMVGQLLWVLVVMPETKGVPLEEMQAKLGMA